MTPETETQIFEKLKEIESRIEKLEARKFFGRKTSFEDSPFFDTAKFKERFNHWPREKLNYYYQAACDYSQANGALYKDWGVAVANWHRKDEAAGKWDHLQKPDYHVPEKVDDPCEPGEIRKALESVKIKTIEEVCPEPKEM